MQKPATTDHPVHDFIVKRWSPRAFSDKPVPPDVLRSLFEAARWAASSYNDQPWSYIVATKDDKENFSKMLGVLMDMNAAWPRMPPFSRYRSRAGPSNTMARRTPSPFTISERQMPN